MKKIVRAGVRNGLAVVGVLTIAVRVAMTHSQPFRESMIRQAKKRANDPNLPSKKRKRNAVTAVYWQTFPW